MASNMAEDYDMPDEEKTRLEKLSEKPCLLYLTFIAFCIYGIMGVTFDWLWVSDMLNVQEALVFGPPSDATINTLIVIASFGTVAFGFEVSNFIMKVKRGHKLVPEDIAQLISLFAEEVPSITLNYLLAACREVPVSYYAMVKAGLAMFGAGLRATTMFFNYIQPRKKAKRHGFIPWLFRTAILVACIYNFTGAICVWIFTYQEPSDADVDGGFRPAGSVSKSYDTDRYLYKAGVFFSHPNFAQCNGNQEDWEKQQFNWAQLVEIYDVTDANGEHAYVTFGYNATENYLYMKVPEVDRTGITGYKESCHQVILGGNCTVNELDPNQCDAINTFQNKFNFTFYSVPKTKTIVFGDVKANVSASVGSSCQYPTLDPDGSLIIGNETVAKMQYFRVRREVNDSYIGNFLYDDDTDGYRYYKYPGREEEQENIVKNNLRSFNEIFQRSFDSENTENLKQKVFEDEDRDLLNVLDEWKTGYQRCDMSGSLRPNPVNLQPGDC